LISFLLTRSAASLLRSTFNATILVLDLAPLIVTLRLNAR